MNEENKRLKKWIKDHDVYEREKDGERDMERDRLEMEIGQLEEENGRLKGKIGDDRGVYEGVIRELKDANTLLENKVRDTDSKVK